MPPPRKKDRLRGSLSPVREQFPPTGTLCGGQAELPGKSRPDEGTKTVPGGGSGTVRRLRHGGTADIVCGVMLGSDRPGCLPGQGGNGGHHVWGGAGGLPHWAPGGTEGTPGRKTVPGEGRELCAGCAMGEQQAMGVSGAGKAPHWAPAGAEGTPGRKNSPRRGPEAVWMRDMGVTCPGRSV